MWEILDRVMSISRAQAVEPPGVLGVFRDIIAADSSVVKVHDKLRPVWKGSHRSSAKKIRQIYRLRWEVETFFKLCKPGCGMNERPSSKESIVRLLGTAGLLRATLSMRARAATVRRFAPAHAHRVAHRIAPLQWVRWWHEELRGVLGLTLLRLGGGRPRTPAEELAMRLDPNQRTRPPTRAVSAGATE